MSKLLRLPLFLLSLVLACDAPATVDPVARTMPRLDMAVERTIHADFQGTTINSALVPDPAAVAHCGATAYAWIVQLGSGAATHLGGVWVLNDMCVNPDFSWTSNVVFTAANGDEISGQISGTAALTSPQMDYVWFSHVIHLTQGTGRFANVALDVASGAWHGGGNLADGSVHSTLDGTITYAAGDRSGH